MLGVDKGLGLWYTCVILDKEMCIDHHITNTFRRGSYNPWSSCRSVVQYISSNRIEEKKGA